MEWMYKSPEATGKYIVETKTIMGGTNVMKSFYNKKTEKWSFKNQIFYRFLKE